MTPLNIVTHYGNEKYDYVSKAELTSFDFYYKNADYRNITGGYPITFYKFAEKFNFVKFQELKDIKWDGSKYSKEEYSDNNIMITRGDKELLTIFANDTDYIKNIEKNLKNSNNYQYVYANGDSNLYLINSK